MRFLRQTLLSVCLILACAVGFAQPPVTNNDDASGPEDSNIVIAILGNDLPGGSGIDFSSVDLDPGGPLDPSRTVTEGTFMVDALGVVTFTPIPDYFGPVTPISYTIEGLDDLVSAAADINVTVDPVDGDPPTIGTISNQTINEDGSINALPFTIGDPDGFVGVTVTGLSADDAIIPDGNITLGGSDADRTVTITPLPNQNGGPVAITINVDDGSTAISTTFDVMVTPVNDPPTIGTISNQTINEDGSINALPFTIGDPDGFVGVTVTGLSANDAIIPDGNITLGGNDADRTVTIAPLPNQNGGPVAITVNVDDGSGAVSTTFDVMVTPVNDPPTIGTISNQTINEDGSINDLPFTIGDPDGFVGVTVTGLSADDAIIPDGNITLGGSDADRTVTITPLPDQSGGPVAITIEVRDGIAAASSTFDVTVTSLDDDPPIMDPISPVTIVEDAGTSGPYTLSATDADTPIGSLTFSVTSNSNPTLIPPSGIIITGDQITLNPAGNQFGTANITIQVDDGNGGIDSEILVLTVTSVNDLPIMNPISPVTRVEDAGAAGPFTLSASDLETPAGTLTYSVTSNSNATLIPPGGIVITGNQITLTPAGNQFGTANLTIQVNDGNGGTDSEVLVLTVTSVNDLPIMNPISPVTIAEDAGASGPFTLSATDVETPVGSLTYSVTSNSNPTLIPPGGIVISGDQITLTPAGNLFGTANITIQVNDGNGGIDSEILVLTVTSVNDLPIMNPISPVTRVEDAGAAGPFTLSASDLETPAGMLTYSVTSNSNATLIPPGGIVITGNQITLTPAGNQFGTANLTIQVNDGNGGTDSEVLVLTVTSVNDIPIMNPISPVTIAEDGTAGPIILTATDMETAVGSLAFSVTTNSNPTLIPPGGIVITGNQITLTPAGNQFGTANLTIQVNDGDGGIDSEVLALTVTSQNDPPVAANDNASTNEDTPVSRDVKLNDADGDGSIASVDLDPGTVGVQTTFTNAAGTWSIVSGEVMYSPILDYTGPASVSYVAVDNEGASSNVATFTVAIIPVNDPPTITAIGNQAIAEDTPTAALAFTVGDIDTPVGSLTVTGTSNATTVIPNANIVITGTGASRTVTLTPASDQSGLAVISLTVSDGTTNVPMSFAVTVNPVSDPPTITAIPNQLIDEDSNTGALPFTIGDIDNPAGTLALAGGSSNLTLVPIGNIVFGGSGANRTVTVTPAADQTGVAIITVTVGDGTTAVPTSFQVTVDGFNDPPTISAIANQSTSEDLPTAAIPFTVGDPETPAADLTVTATSDNVGIIPNANIIIAGSGASRTVQVTPEPNQSGAAIITLTVSDGVNSTPTSFQVTVNTVDDAPTITAIPNQTIAEDAQTTALAFTINDVETPLPSLTVAASSGNVALVPLANILLTGSGANHTIQVTPLPNQFGTAVITVTVNDGTNTTSTTFQVNVTSVNDAPTITAITDRTVNEDISTGALSFTVTDAETPVASLTVTGSSDNTTLVPVANMVFGGSGGTRTVTVTPAANQTGVATLTITVNDGTANVSTTFQLTVDPVNDAPVITGQTLVSTAEEQPLDIEFSHITVTDVDDIFPTDFTLTVLTNPGYSLLGNTITPNTNVTGNIVVRVSVNDGALNSNIYNLQVTVNPINDPPVITAQSTLTILEDTPLTFLLSHVTIVDPDNSSGFTFALSPGSNYSVSGGNLITPAAHFNGTLSIPVTVSDGTSASAPYNLQIQVTPVNDKPQITGQTPISIAEVQPVTLDLSQLTVFDPDNNFPADFELAISTGPNYSAVGNVVTPVVNFSGTLLVRIKVSDLSLESDYYDFQILVNSTNDPPVITGQRPLNTEENEPLQIQFVDLTVSDPDNTYPTGFTLTILPGTTYTFLGTTVTPNPNVSGLIDVRVKVNDGAVDSAPYLLKIDVNSVNDAPVITGQLPMTALEDAPVINMSMGFLIISDPDSPISGFTMTVSPGTHYTLANGVEITPEANYYGTLSVPVIVNDGSLDSQPYNVQIQITPVNDAPTITGQNPLSAVEDQGIILKLEDFLVADIDNTFPTGFTLQVAQGSFPNYDAVGTTVTPKDNFTGTLGVAVTVSDGAATSGTYSAAIVVGTINDPPTLDPIGNITIQEDPEEPSVISLTGITAGVGEGGTQLVTVTISTNEPEWFEVFEVTYPGSTLGTIRIKPKADQTGTAQVSVRIQDDGLATPPHVNFFEYTFDFTIDPVNDAPTFTSQPLKLAETAQGFEYLVEVGDVEQGSITITAPTLPTWLILTQGSNGKATLSGIPPVGTTGEVSVVIVASDPMGSVSTQDFKIVVNGRPTITPFAINTDEDKRYEFLNEFATNYNDPDGNPMVAIRIKQLPTKGQLLLKNVPVILDAEIQKAEIEELDYRPSADSNGTDIIKWNATDGIYYGHLDANIVVSIIPFNDPPEVIALEAPETDTLKYELGSESPVKLTSIFDARDPEGDNIIAAEIGFQISTDYRDGKDIFSFRDTLGIVGAFIEELGVLTLTGKASVQDYVAAIRTVRYNYLDASPDDDDLNRKVSIRLNDGNYGGTKERLIGLIYTNPGLDIANAFTPNGDDDNKYWRIYSPAGLERYKDALIRVYDKRGALVYQATGFSTPWYGDGPEGVLPADSYYYTIDLRYDKKKYKGVVTILR